MVRDSSLLENECIHYDEPVSSYLPRIAVIGLCQDESTQLTPVVSKGETVTEGQILGSDVHNPHAACVHSPIPGQVLDFFTVSMPNGKKTPSILIRLYGSFTFLGKPFEGANWMFPSAAQRIKKMAEMGIINTFSKPCSLALQLSKKSQRNQTLVVRLFDSDPSYYTDGFIAEFYKDHVLEGSAIIADTMNAKSVIFLYSKDKWLIPEENQLKYFKSMQVSFVPVNDELYPAGTVRELIQAVRKYDKKGYLGSTPKELDADEIMIDSTTALSVYDALVRGVPVIERVIHVSGNALRSGGNFKVRIGTSIRKLIDECGGFTCEPAKIIINGIVNGISICDLDTPITKYVKAVSILAPQKFPDQMINECIRCGRCHHICPSHIHPEKIYEYYMYKTPIQSAAASNIEACSQCLLCNTVCPSRLPLCQTVQLVKGIQNENRL